MARNKHPEETVQKIMKVAAELFLEKGYDNTSMQDIVNRLGMSKGAIYHHFKSKEDLMKQITGQYFDNIDWFMDIVNDANLTGLEKLRHIFSHELGNEVKKKYDSISRPLLQDPVMFMEQIHCSINEVAPILTKVIEEGNQDGSLHTRYSKQAAELLLLSINIWINPGIFACSKEEFIEKIQYLKFVTDNSGIPIFNDEILTLSEAYYDTSVGRLQK